MYTTTIEILETIPLPPEKTFARLSDHDRLGGVLGIPVKRTRDGEGDVNGVGSVRTMGFKPLDFDETVTRFEPSSRIDYRITRGTPLKNHSGTILFRPTAEGTRVEWSIRFDLPLPLAGLLVKAGLGFGISRGLRKLGRS